MSSTPTEELGLPIEPMAVQPVRKSRRPLLIAGAIAGVLAVVGGAWAVKSFLLPGAQPAEALPASTIAYLAVDLDPSASQKIEAYQFLKRFPTIKRDLSLDAQDKASKNWFDALTKDSKCKNLDFAKDVEPWLGARASVALVDLGEKTPTVVGVVQVTDEAAAKTGLKAISACAGDIGFAVDGDWAVLGEKASQAEKVIADAARGSLADDKTFQTWIGQLGDPGIVTMYSSPAAGKALIDSGLGDLMSSPAGMSGPGVSEDEYFKAYDKHCKRPASAKCQKFLNDPNLGPGSAVPEEPTISDETRKQLEDYAGGAASIGFVDGALQAELAVSSDKVLLATGANVDSLVAGLPADSAMVASAAFKKGWVSDFFDELSTFGFPTSDFVKSLEQDLGLSIADMETLFGTRTAFAFGPGVFDSSADSSDPSTMPLGLLAEGDPAAIEAALDKLRGSSTFTDRAAPTLVSETVDGRVAFGFQQAYVTALASGDGKLGSTADFKNLVGTSHPAAEIVYLNFDAEHWLDSAVADADPSVKENLKPLVGLGITAWLDGKYQHSVIRLSNE